MKSPVTLLFLQHDASPKLRALCTSTVVVANARERQRPQIDAKTPRGRACRDQEPPNGNRTTISARRHPQPASQIRSSMGTPKSRPSSSAISNEIPHLYMGGPSSRSGGDTLSRICAAASSAILSTANQRLRNHREMGCDQTNTYRSRGVCPHEFRPSVFPRLRELRADGSRFEVVLFKQSGEDRVHAVEGERRGAYEALR
jgi:hypothetical protein